MNVHQICRLVRSTWGRVAEIRRLAFCYADIGYLGCCMDDHYP